MFAVMNGIIMAMLYLLYNKRMNGIFGRNSYCTFVWVRSTVDTLEESSFENEKYLE